MASLHRLPTFVPGGSGKSQLVHVVVECPRGSTAKLKFDPKLGAMKLGRTLPFGVAFPFDFGFVPSTYAEDGDPLDGMIFGDAQTFPGVVVACRPIGVLRASQAEKTPGKKKRVRNDRVLFVADDDRRNAQLDDVAKLSERERDELAAFFIAAVALEGKELAILGWGGPAVAREAIKSARSRK